MDSFNDLLAEIELIPAVDVHTNVDASSFGAADPAELVASPEIAAELACAGAIPAGADIDAKLIAGIAPRLEEIRNTTSYWCLSAILSDLFGAEHAPHESDMQELAARIQDLGSRQDWASEVLDRGHVRKVLYAADWRGPLPRASSRFAPILKLDQLLNEPHLTKNIDRLADVSGQTVYEAADLKKALEALIGKAKACGAVAACSSFGPQVDFEPSNRESADRVIALVLLGQKADRDDRRALRSYVMDQVLVACAEHDMSFQLMLGVRGVTDEIQISAYEPAMVCGYASLFARHSRVRFDVLAANETLAHELAVVAGACRNVHLAGPWMFLAYPATMARIIRQRIEMLPMGKHSVLASRAGCVEWVYGRAAVVRREVAAVVSGLVDEGCMSRGAAVDTARRILHENPERIYRLE